MRLHNSFLLFGKEVTKGPRGSMMIWMIAFPLIITFVVRLVLGDLIDPSPRLGIVDQGESDLVGILAQSAELDLSIVAETGTLREMVEAHDLDAGLILQPRFDTLVADGQKPALQLLLSGESLANDRAVLVVAVIDAVRGLSGSASAVNVRTVHTSGAASVPIAERLVPLLVLFAVAMCGIFLPASSIIAEKESRTLEALLVTPIRAGDVLLAKGTMGFLLAFITGALTLLLNGGFTSAVGGQLVVLAVAALMSVVLGLLAGAAVKNMNMFFTLWKSAGIIVFAPAVLYLFPALPGWIPRLFPTHYFLGPLNEMAISGAALGDVWVELMIAVAITAALAALAAPVARRMERVLAIG